MVKSVEFQGELESFSNILDNYDEHSSLPGARLNPNKVLNLLFDAVSDFNVQGVLYENESLLTYLEHEPVETYVFPQSLQTKLEQKHKLIKSQINKPSQSIIYVKSVAELGGPNAANQVRYEQTDGFVTCVFYRENGRKGLILFSLSDKCSNLDEETLLILQHYGQLAYHKISDIAAENEKMIRLTPRESEMVKFIAKGRSNPEIAEITGLSVHTVNGYLRGIYLKTSTKDRVSLSLYALHKGLLL